MATEQLRLDALEEEAAPITARATADRLSLADLPESSIKLNPNDHVDCGDPTEEIVGVEEQLRAALAKIATQESPEAQK